MGNKKLINIAELLFSVFFYSGIFFFFTFFYNNHLHFQEQFQLFLLTDDFFLTMVSRPGGFAGYTGGFLTQFYYLTIAGPLIITGLLYALQQFMKGIILKINSDRSLFPFSFIPSLSGVLVLCNEFYPLSAIVGFLIAMITGLGYMRVRNHKARFITGIILMPVTYWLAGGSYMSLLLIMLVYEAIIFRRFIRKELTSYNLKSWYFIAYPVLAAGMPVLVRQFIIIQPAMTIFISNFYYNKLTGVPVPVLLIFILPPLLMVLVNNISIKEKQIRIALTFQFAGILILCFSGLISFANFDAEKVMKYDFMVRNGKWNEVIRFAEKNPPRNFLSLAMLNLSLAKTGQMGDRMFNFEQHGVNGLFLPFNKEYVAPLIGNEIFYHIGLINASQVYAFESMETIPDMGKSARILKRLAETNLINGQYGVSEKYLRLLEKTIFYRKWAKKTLTYLDDEEKINSDPEWGEKRRMSVRGDYFFHVQNIEAALNRMVKEHPDNKIAFEYLMAFYLINKDLGNFMNLVPMLGKNNYNSVPVSYQEAMMYIVATSEKDPFVNSSEYIAPGIQSKIQAYADIFNTYPDAGERLKGNYGGTYWYYLHFNELETSQDKIWE